MERRSRGGPCQCRFKCFEGISEETLDGIFTSFYEIGDKEQQDVYLGKKNKLGPRRHVDIVICRFIGFLGMQILIPRFI